MARILEDITKYDETFNKNLFKTFPKDYFYKFSELIEYITLYNKCVSKIRLAELNSSIEELEKANQDEQMLFSLKERYFLKKRIEQELSTKKTNIEKNILTNSIVSKKDTEQLKEINKKIEETRNDIEKIVLNISRKKINIRKSENTYNNQQNTIAQMQVELNNSVKGLEKCLSSIDYDTMISLVCNENATRDYRNDISNLSIDRKLDEYTLNIIAKKFESIIDLYIFLFKKSYAYTNETIEKYQKRELNENNIMEYINIITPLSSLQYEDRIDYKNNSNDYINSLPLQLYSLKIIKDNMTETFNEYNIENFREEKNKLNLENTKSLEKVLELVEQANKMLNKNKNKKNVYIY